MIRYRLFSSQVIFSSTSVARQGFGTLKCRNLLEPKLWSHLTIPQDAPAPDFKPEVSCTEAGEASRGGYPEREAKRKKIEHQKEEQDSRGGNVIECKRKGAEDEMDLD